MVFPAEIGEFRISSTDNNVVFYLVPTTGDEPDNPLYVNVEAGQERVTFNIQARA